MVALAFKHDIRPLINSRWKISDLPQAHSQVESGRTVGKVVVDVEGGWH